MAEESAVKVCVRVRPLIEREETAIENTEPVNVYWKADKQTIHQIDDGNLTKHFGFDRVFSAEETTQQLYQELAKPLVVSTVEGYNGTIFAYGQTSSGKTFTMMGCSLTPGVIPLAMADVFQTIKNCPKKEFLLRVSYLEIYNETVTDLLCDSWKRKPLEIREGNHKNVYVADLTEELVTSPEQALAWLKKGEKNRHYGTTKMNQRSSRSHTIFRMILESRDRGDPASGENSDGAIIVSHLNLVDLAGAERASQTGAEGTRFKEGCNINRSLFTLGQVIKKLSDETQKGFTNYRDSKLTRILQNSLGGNAKTVIICTITPVTLEETLSTLQFASAAKNMKNDPHVTEVSDDGALLRRYRNEIADLKRRLHEVSSVTQTTATEKETLSQILQEKDQLQREQEDRIRNLTKLLVTSSNFVPIKTMPKRRVTWAGKLPSPAFHHVGESDLCISEPIMKKRKNDMSVLMEQNEDSEEFDFTFDRELNQSSVPFCAESEFFSGNQLEVMEKVETESRVAELEKMLEENVQMSAETQEQMKKELEETIQLCETLVSEKETIAAEQESLKEELNILTEQIDHLKKEKASLLLEMEEKKEMDEFNSLEDEIKKEYEKEILNEMSSLKKAMEASEGKCQELQADMVAMSEELKKKSEWAEELQRLSDVDLVQQVKQLRRSLDDAEGLSRDTKKEWAHLRTENISLKERDVTLTAGYERVESEMKSLCRQLEAEKARFKSMQNDLQRELQDAFKENTKLTTLLDGKVPKNLIDSIELEKVVACLKKQLETSHEAERTLRLKVEDLTALQHLPEQVESLMKQLKESEACRSSNENKLSGMQDVINELEEKLVDSEMSKTQNDSQFMELQDQMRLLSEELETVRAERMCLMSEKTNDPDTHAEELVKLQSTVSSLTEERDQLQEMMEGLREERNQLKRDLEENMDMQQLDSEEQPHKDLQEDNLHLQMQLEVVKDLKEQLEAVKEERDQLKADLQDNVEMMIENQEELREAQKEIQSLQEKKHLKTEIETGLKTTNDPESASCVTELKKQIKLMNEEFESLRAERDCLLSKETFSSENHTGQLEKLLSTVTSLTEERDQLQEMMEGLKEERTQLKRDLEENVEMMQQLREELESVTKEICQLKSELKEKVEMAEHLSEELESVQADRSHLLSEEAPNPENHAEDFEKLLSTVTSLTEERDQIQQNLETVEEERNQLNRELQEKALETQGLLHSIQEELKHQTHLNSELKAQSLQKECLLEQQAKQLSEELETERAERMLLLSEKTPNTEKRTEELEKLLSTVTSLTEERDQLQEMMEGLKEERTQLKRDLEENVEMMILNQLQSVQAQSQCQEATLQQKIQQLGEELDTMKKEICQLKSELKEKEEMAKQLSEELETERAERMLLLSEKTPNTEKHTEELEKLLSTVTSLTEERDQLQEMMEGLKEERTQLKRDLEENVEMVILVQEELNQQKQLQSVQAQSQCQEATLKQKIQQLGEELETKTKEICQLKSDLKSKEEMADAHAEELEKLLSTVTSLTEERDQLQEMMEGLKEERTQLKRDLEENVEMMALVHGEMKQQQHLHSEHQNEWEREEATLQQKALETQGLLHSIQEELKHQTHLNSELKAQSLQKESLLEQQAKQLSEELETERAERMLLLSEKTPNTEKHTEELEKLLSTVTSLTEERDQLQELMEGLKEERTQLKRDLEENVEMMILNQQKQLQSVQAQSQCQEATLQQKIQQLGEELETKTKEICQLKSDLKSKEEMADAHAEELEKLLSTVTSLTEERDQLQEMMEGLKEERTQLKRDLEENVEMMILNQLQSVQAQSQCQEATLQQKIQQLGEELETKTKEICQLKCDLKSKEEMADTHGEELENLLSTVTSLTEERDQLQELMEGLKEERTQLKRDLEENVDRIHYVGEELETMTKERCQLKDDLEGKEKMAKQLSEELESVRAERKHLMSENAASSEKHAVELEKLQSTVTSLNEERNQLQLTLEGIRGERNQLKNDLVENIKVASFFRFQLVISGSSKHVYGPLDDVERVQEVMILKLLPLVSEVTRKLFSNVNRYTFQTTKAMWDIKVLYKLWAKECKTHFEALVQNDLSLYEERRLQDLLLCRAQASGHSVKVAENDLRVVWDQRLLDLQMRRGEHLEKMDSVLEKIEERLALHPARVSAELRERAKRNEELSALCMASSPDSAAVGRFLERELVRCSSVAQATTLDLQGLRDEYHDLLKEQNSVRLQSDSQLKEERSKRCTLLQKLENTPVKTEAILLWENQQHIIQHQLKEEETKISDAKVNISVLTEQTNNLEKTLACGTPRAKDGFSPRLKASEQIQASFLRFQLVISGSSKHECGPLDDVERVLEAMKLKLLPLVSEVTRKLFSNVNRYTFQTTKAMLDMKVLYTLWAKECKTHFEALVQNDFSVCEERRLQDLLLCRAQASGHSVKVAENDLRVVWDQRLLDLQMRRGEHLEKMNSVLEKIEERLALHPARVSAELREREKRNEELSALCMASSPDSAAVERFLERELVRCSSVAQATTLDLQGLRDEYHGLLKEQNSVRLQSDSQLKEERSKRCTLLQKLENTPVKTEAILLWENQQPFPQRQQLEGETKALAERTSTRASECQELKTKVVKMELEMTALSSKHKEELLKMTTILNHKEEALRTLKETLRRSQQEGEQSFMEGEDLHARLRNTRGRTVHSNILIEKNKLEEEVKLQKRISELESFVSTQQAELTKWKTRAIKLKKRDVLDKPLSPSTPTKRLLPVNSEDFLNSPKKFLDSPKKFLDSPKKFLDSPKSKFFDVRPGSESMSVNRPKQFFDNSTFESIQDADKEEDWCPLSPKQQDLCKQQ
ncbi:hypothetical protein UPYG_G00185320 [Umbra pygmaea]|uniref:Centromere-associated protein E n=1 Tax=Umbra pygmaea TaxID=75934 RepID=A0ABD0X884_UMBPY